MPPIEACPTITPLFASLREEAEKHQVHLDLGDYKLVAKLTALATRVPREYEIIQRFRIFLEDPNHPSPFFFPDRFDRIRKVPAGSPSQVRPPEHCAYCGADGVHTATCGRPGNPNGLPPAEAESDVFSEDPSAITSPEKILATGAAAGTAFARDMLIELRRKSVEAGKTA